MGQEIKIVLPKLGESILSATVVKWFKQVGDTVQEEEPLLEVTTDKVNSEIPSTVTGVLREIVALTDQEIQVGETLAVIVTGGGYDRESEKEGAYLQKEEVNSKVDRSSFFSPVVIRVALENGLSMQELETLQGSGLGGRVSKQDLERYLAKRAKKPIEVSKEFHGSIEKVKMTTMRKAIAENMVKSFYEAPHASLVTEVDVTEIVKYLEKEKDLFFKNHGYKITLTSFISQAIAQAAVEFPLINSSLDDDMILMKKFVNLGIAVSVDQGIMVPVIKDCHKLSLEQIAKALSELALKARNSELKVMDTKEGTITMTNFGMTGTLMGIPIIRYPEVAIVGVGAMTKRVVVLNDDTVGIRSMVYISLTFDHRVIDGIYGCNFLNALKKHIENSII
jgi:2-oxoglutarate dehydrogenase E2 component (dihydrolipoamide succinyltransferase)